MKRVKLTAIGNSTGIIIPKEILDRMNASKGDTLAMTETPDGFQISAFDENQQRQMEIAERIMRENRNTRTRPNDEGPPAGGPSPPWHRYLSNTIFRVRVKSGASIR